MFSRRAFTLVELLVVIGIIAVLVGILLPTLNKARESGRQAQCLSNLKQIATATVLYCNDYKGYFPAASGQGAGWREGGPTGNDPTTQWGWIAWRRSWDPIRGKFNTENTVGSGLDQNITHSALARYMNVKPTIHATPVAAHDVSPSLEAVFRCPSDNLERRPITIIDNNGGRGAYRYSYSMNIFASRKVLVVRPDGSFVPGEAPKPSRKISDFRGASEKVLYVCEDEASINNGEFNPCDPDPSKWDYSAVASRHEMKAKQKAQDARGNVGFADGHAGFVNRAFIYQRVHMDPDYTGH